MRRTRVKICGITRPEDAILAAKAGADAIGMVFHPQSPRNVSIGTARQILEVLPPFVTPVGLFVDADASQIMETAMELGFRDVQLHGHETPGLVDELEGLQIIKAVRVSGESLARSIQLWKTVANLCGIVLETDSKSAPGGTGIANDWKLILQASKSGLFEGAPPLIAAGGLRPENVGDIVRTLRPYAVDVSSGVESSRGIKSESLILAFIQAVTEADSEVGSASNTVSRK